MKTHITTRILGTSEFVVADWLDRCLRIGLSGSSATGRRFPVQVSSDAALSLYLAVHRSISMLEGPNFASMGEFKRDVAPKRMTVVGALHSLVQEDTALTTMHEDLMSRQTTRDLFPPVDPEVKRKRILKENAVRHLLA